MSILTKGINLQYRKRHQTKTRLNTINNHDGEEEEQIWWGADLSDDGKSSPHGPCKLAGGGGRSPGNHLGHCRLGERKINNGVKAYSGSHLIQSNLVLRTCLTDGSDMLMVWDLTIYHRSRAAHNICPHPYFVTLKFRRCMSHVPSY
jgi:hypothetical protein